MLFCGTFVPFFRRLISNTAQRLGRECKNTAFGGSCKDMEIYVYRRIHRGTLPQRLCYPYLSGIRDNSGYTPELKNFRKFLPTDWESAYPKTPFIIDEGSRWQYYRDALTGEKKLEESLTEGSKFLNSLLKQAESEVHLRIEDYRIPGFDPANPMEKY